MTKIVKPAKRRLGQCLSCDYFYTFSDFPEFPNFLENKETCRHTNNNDIESTNFCYDWKDLENPNE